jgi:hypothetical protein
MCCFIAQLNCIAYSLWNFEFIPPRSPELLSVTLFIRSSRLEILAQEFILLIAVIIGFFLTYDRQDRELLC